jgi:hypothetical protein
VRLDLHVKPVRAGGHLALDEVVAHGKAVGEGVSLTWSRELERLEVFKSPMPGEQVDVEGERVESVVR